MLIGELAARCAVSTRSLRYYETRGLLTAARDHSGYRRYDEGDVAIVTEIAARLADGFTLAEIRPFVACLRAGNAAGDACPEPRRVYRRKIAEIDACVERLRAVRAQLAARLADAPPCPTRGLYIHTKVEPKGDTR